MKDSGAMRVHAVFSIERGARPRAPVLAHLSTRTLSSRVFALCWRVAVCVGRRALPYG